MTPALLLAASLSTAPVPAAPPPPEAAASGVSPDDRKKALFLADLLFESRRFQELEAAVTEWLAKDPEKGEWLVRMARLRAEQGRNKEAAGTYKQLLAERGDDSGILTQIGLHSYAAGDLAAAREYLSRALEHSANPDIPYHLAEISFAEGDAAGGRRWAEKALAQIPDASSLSNKRRRLRLRSRLGWDDALDQEYQQLYASNPQDAETLLDWGAVLVRAGHYEALEEPVALLKERFPDTDKRRRHLESDLLSRKGDKRKLTAFYEESSRLYPDDASYRYPLGEAYFEARRWEDSRREFRATQAWETTRRASEYHLEELHRQYDHHAGPHFFYKHSEGSIASGLSAQYHGYARRDVRVEARAGRTEYRRRSSGAGAGMTGLWGSIARESSDWVLGTDFDLSAAPGLTALSPGAFGEWSPCKGCLVKGSGALRRAWTGSGEGALVGAKTDIMRLSGRFRPLPRLSLGGRLAFDRITVRPGGTALQTQWGPEAIWVLKDRPFYSGLSYRLSGGGASGDPEFFTSLPLLGRHLTHYLTLSASRHFVERKLRMGAYVYNGHDSGRSRRFGTASLVGGGADCELQTGNIQWLCSYEYSQDDESGVGGKSHTIRFGALWRWERKEGSR